MRHLRPAGILAAGIGAWAACGATARAQGLLPPTGVDTRVGDLRGYFEQAFGQVVPPEAGTHAWNYSASLDVSETYDTGVPISSGGNNQQAHDFITRITPSVGVTGDSARLVGSLFYGPSANIYLYHGNQNNIAQNLNGAATITVIPDFFFVDLRAFAGEQSITGYNGPASTNTVSSSNEALTTSFSISPTLRHSFSTLASAELGYTLSRTAYDANNAVASSTAAQVNQNFTSQQENAILSTGEDFGQFSDSLSANATQSSGTGPQSGAYSYNYSNSVSYAVTRTLFANGSIGHETYYYGGPTPYSISDVTWNIGARWTPNPDSSISVGYGHQQGNSSFNMDATYAATADTRIYARYSQGVGSQSQNLQTAVASTTVNSNGVTVDRTTGQPVVLTNNFFLIQTQNSLFRTSSFSVSGVLLWPRDIFNVSAQYQQSTQLTSGVVGVPASSNSSTGTYATFSWSHDVSDDLHTNALIQYGVNSGSGTGTVNGNQSAQGSFLLNIGMTYSISDTVSTSAQLTYTTEPTGILTATGTTSNTSEARVIAVVSLHKNF